MTQIAVTGANGFVGKHLIKELLGHGYEVLAIEGSSLPGSKKQEGVTCISVDLSKPNEVRSIDLSGVEAIIHLAGLAAVGPSFDDPMRYIYTNVSLETNLFQRAVEQKVKPRFIVISTGSLYDPSSPLPITEATPVVSTSPYAVSKIAQEQMGHYYGTRGFEVIVARPFNHIGPGQEKGFLVPDLTSQIVSCEQGVAKRVVVGNLDAKRDYTDVRDIARAYRLLLEKGKSGETYNICTGTPKSGHEILEAILSEATVKPKIEQDPSKMRPSDTPEIYGSRQKFTKDTGWKPEIALETTIHDVIEDWRNKS